MASSAIDTKISGPLSTCSGCGKNITDRFLLKALDLLWHEDCLKCGCCDCRLGEVGSTLYTRANLILCKRDYLRLFGTTGNCAACCKVIPAFEMVMRAKNNVYHLDCFACHQCHQRFCVGDRFYLHENKILCEYDYEERIIFANMASNPSNAPLLQRRVTDYQQAAGKSHQLAPAEAPPLWVDPNAAPTGSLHSAPEGPKACLLRKPMEKAKNHGSRIKNYSPSDGSSSGYGSPDSGMLEEG